MIDTIKSLIMTRGVQLLARYSGVGLAMLAGKASVELPAADAAGAANTVGLLVGAGLCLLIDLISHWWNKRSEK
jgi:hypothetical protein